MMVVAELEDCFLPAPDDLLVNLQESRGVVDALLDALPSMFSGTQQVHGPFNAPGQQVGIGRLAVGPLELARKVRGGHHCLAGHRRDIQRLIVVPVHQVLGPAKVSQNLQRLVIHGLSPPR